MFTFSYTRTQLPIADGAAAAPVGVVAGVVPTLDRSWLIEINCCKLFTPTNCWI
jgi:hypothetical protein